MLNSSEPSPFQPLNGGVGLGTYVGPGGGGVHTVDPVGGTVGPGGGGVHTVDPVGGTVGPGGGVQTVDPVGGIVPVVVMTSLCR